jgi:hypothetical protein
LTIATSLAAPFETVRRSSGSAAWQTWNVAVRFAASVDSQ